MVGHTGDIPAAVTGDRDRRRAACAGSSTTVLESGGACIVTADHGNAEHMLEPDGSPNTAHTTNPVPLIVTARGDRAARRRHPRRRLADRPRPARDRAAAGDDRASSLGHRVRRCATTPTASASRSSPATGTPAPASCTRRTGRSRRPCFVPLATRGSVKGLLARRGRRGRLRDGPRQHLPPDAVAGRRADRGARRPPRVHGLGAGDHHRFRRFPGLFARPRRGRRRGQGTARAPAARGRSARDLRGGRPLPLLHRRRGAVPLAGALDGGPGGARLRHRARLRRVHAVPRRPRLHGRARPSARIAGSTAASTGTARTGRPARRSSGSSRAASTRTCAASRRRPSRRPASTGSRSAARSAATRSRCARSSR